MARVQASDFLTFEMSFVRPDCKIVVFLACCQRVESRARKAYTEMPGNPRIVSAFLTNTIVSSLFHIVATLWHPAKRHGGTLRTEVADMAATRRTKLDYKVMSDAMNEQHCSYLGHSIC